ncbi:cAMP receptor protein [compost metagenome]
MLLALLEEQPLHWRQLALLMSQKLRMTFINLEQLSLMPAPTRLAHRLLMIAAGYGEIDEPRRVLHLPQEQLASMLSLSRQTTNQILKDLQGQGIIGLSYGEIEILDAERLRSLATI